jgi:hypothetical protein
MSKAKVISVIDKKISNADNNSRVIEKSYCKGQMDIKTFMSKYIDERKNFHKNSIMKVKVSTS